MSINEAATAKALAMSPVRMNRYRRFTSRNSGFISGAAQDKVRASCVLVAGCGSTGGAAVEPLARLGVEEFIVVDVDTFELHNLNRQIACFDDVGRHKAVVAGERIASINSDADVTIYEDGVNHLNIEHLVTRSDIIIDGIDVTTGQGWIAKFALHQTARRHRKPVISGFDMAGRQHVQVYDYRFPKRTRFGIANLQGHDLKESPWVLLRRTLPLRTVPGAVASQVLEIVHGQRESLSQMVYTSDMFGAICARLMVTFAEGQQLPRTVQIDLDDLTVVRTARISNRIQGTLALMKLVRHMRKSQIQKAPGLNAVCGRSK